MSDRLGKDEKEHYSTIDQLYAAGYAEGTPDAKPLVLKIQQMLDHWDAATGRRFGISKMIDDHIRGLSSGDREAAKTLYCLISPLLFFVSALREIARKSYRNAVVQCGIFCERIARNLLQELPSSKASDAYSELRDDTFEARVGRVRGKLSALDCDFAEPLFNHLKNIYFMRNKRGPHDVPPPEPIQARICITESLPAYIDYLLALNAVGVHIDKSDNEKFVNLFYALTEMKPSLVTGGDMSELPSIASMITELYRQEFFSEERKLQTVIERLQTMRYNYPKPTVANALSRQSSAKNGFLSRRRTSDGYVYAQKIPPSETFKSSF